MSAAGSVYVEDTSIVGMGRDVRFIVNSQPSDGSPRLIGEVTAACRSKVYFFTPLNPDGSWGYSDQTLTAAPNSPVGKAIQYACGRR